jgi:hypothetical protein
MCAAGCFRMLEPAYKCAQHHIHIQDRRCVQQVAPECWNMCTSVHSITSQNTATLTGISEYICKIYSRIPLTCHSDLVALLIV